MYHVNVLCLILALALLVDGIISKETVLCIQGFQTSECSGCDWYGNLTSSLSLQIQNSTEVKFCESKVTLFSLIHIANKENVLLHGTGHNTSTVIQCQQDFVGNDNGTGFRFTNIVQLQIMKLSFIGCGAIHDGSTLFYGNKNTMPFLASIYIYYSTDVQIKHVEIENGNGTGLAIIDTTGYVEVAYSIFKNNSIKGSTGLSGGRGVYVDFTYCPPGRVSRCENATRNNKNSTYTFKHNEFISNTASNAIHDHTPFQYRSQKQVFQEVGFGGGLTIYIRGDASDNNITLDRCKFYDNKAILGGGLLLSFHDAPNDNSVVIRNTIFDKNVAKKGGGGIDAGYLTFTDHPTSGIADRNFIMFSNCNMTRNAAANGGGTKIFGTRSLRINFNNRIFFTKCHWEWNRARFGSAIEISPHIWDMIAVGNLPQLEFKDCKFLSNSRQEIRIKEDFATNYTWGKGTVLTSSFPIDFSGKTSFQSNNSSALYASSSRIKFNSGSYVEFENNTGYEGAAVALIGFSALHVEDNSTFRFLNNTALSKGGAITYRSNNKLDFQSSRSCFIQYVGSTTSVKERDITFLFQHNKVGTNKDAFGQTIFATTILSCVRGCSGREGKESINCIGTFKFVNEKHHEISTSGARFAVRNSYVRHPISVTPGQEVEFEFQMLDDLNNEAFDSYHVLLDRRSNGPGRVQLDPTYEYITDKRVRLYGGPGEKARVLLGTTGFREITISFEIKMEQCPPGYVTQLNAKLKGMECVCSANTPNKTYVGIERCNEKELKAYMRYGYWFGYDGLLETEETLKSGYCPRGFCSRRRSQLFDSSSTSLNQFICGKDRQGKLCGSCMANHSHYFHSENNKCFANKHCGVGFFLYLVSEIVPVSILFVTVIFFNIRLTSGAVNGCIFFIQFIDTMFIDANGLISFHPIVGVLTSGYLFVYRMFNLNFFTLDQLSFCLWKGANTLDVLSIKYVTIIYSLLLVFTTALLMKVCNITRLKRKTVFKLMSSGGSVKGTMIHGFSTFFVICYTQCAKVTLFLLIPSRIYSVGTPMKHNDTKVVFYAGDYLYFHNGHLKYAIPALIIGIVLVLIPLILLLSYPLCYRVFAILRIEETRFVQVLCKVAPLEKMKPLFDSFQGCYKDKYRFFAGLYFLYRFAALISFLSLDSFTKFYITLEIQLVVMLALQATTYAYRKRWHNILDTVLFADLAIINGITMFNYKLAASDDNHLTINILSGIQVFLILLPMFYISCCACSSIVMRIKNKRNEAKKEEHLTDTLGLIDYREYNSTVTM